VEARFVQHRDRGKRRISGGSRVYSFDSNIAAFYQNLCRQDEDDNSQPVQ